MVETGSSTKSEGCFENEDKERNAALSLLFFVCDFWGVDLVIQSFSLLLIHTSVNDVV